MFMDWEAKLLRRQNSKLICTVNVIPVNISANIFAEINKMILRFIQKFKKSSIAKTIFSKDGKFEGLILMDLLLMDFSASANGWRMP
jgi:hypothetical protein